MATAFGAFGAVSILVLPALSIAAEMRGVTATDIKIGQTMPYSGPVSAFGALSPMRPTRFRIRPSTPRS